MYESNNKSVDKKRKEGERKNTNKSNWLVGSIFLLSGILWLVILKCRDRYASPVPRLPGPALETSQELVVNGRKAIYRS